MIESSYGHRPLSLNGVSRDDWTDWHWQQKTIVRDSQGLRGMFPNISNVQIDLAEEWQRRGFRYALTPYILSLVQMDSKGNPLQSDPVWKQFFPQFADLHNTEKSPRPDEYSSKNENWENSGEMLTPIAIKKYDNRVLIISADACLSYCTYCFRSLVSEASEEKHGGLGQHWQNTLKSIREHPEIEEVILSGGDLLVFKNDKIDRILQEIRSIPSVKMIRIHSRAFTHNPFRIDDGFCSLLKKHNVTGMAVHICHPNEISVDFEACIGRVHHSGAGTLLLAQLPLLKGVNDKVEVLRVLFSGLYQLGVKPYYLFHCMPNVPAAHLQRTSVRRGVGIIKALKRHFSSPAVPEYVIAHRDGKQSVPIETNGTPEFVYKYNELGHPIISFKNWKGEWSEYLDGID
jgi:lysine 2,3-aminomutase